jgi:hypothetical protein
MIYRHSTLLVLLVVVLAFFGEDEEDFVVVGEEPASPFEVGSFFLLNMMMAACAY